MAFTGGGSRSDGRRRYRFGIRRTPATIPAVSADWLKIAGLILMAVYFFGLTVIQNGILGASQYTSEQLNALVESSGEAFTLAGISSVCYLIGVTAVPIFSFLLVQGVIHTSSMKKYLLSVLICALISEVPYDYAVSGSFFNMKDQNVMWTSCIALIMLWLLKTFQGKGLGPIIINALIILGGCFWAVFFNCKFGGAFVLLTAVLFLLREKRGVSIGIGVVLTLIVYATAPLGFIPVGLYSGERKHLDNKKRKYAFYAAYPAMLCVFALWVFLIKNVS